MTAEAEILRKTGSVASVFLVLLFNANPLTDATSDPHTSGAFINAFYIFPHQWYWRKF